MKVNQEQLASFLSRLQDQAPTKLSSRKLARELAKYIESHPSVIDQYGTSQPRRFSYSTVGYGICSLLGEKYRMGRIEVFDKESGSTYQIHEGTYCLPHQTASSFEDFINSLHTDLPVYIALGSRQWCKEECAKALGLNSVDDLNNAATIEKFRQEQLNALAHSKGFKNWQEYLATEAPSPPASK
jgi:hypothetical protein